MAAIQYSHDFKRLVVQKLLSQPNLSVRELAKDMGVSKSTAWEWRTEVCKVQTTMGIEKKKKKVPPAMRSGPEKMRIVLAASKLSDEKLGEFLRREGVFEADLREWRNAMLDGVTSTAHETRQAYRNRIRKLERELKRKDKALKEAKALVVLKKKLQAMWAEKEEDDTDPKSE